MKLMIIVLVNWLLSKLVKSLIDLRTRKGQGMKNVFRNGGIPSSHTVLVVSAVTAIFLHEGLSSTFLVSLVLALIVSYDAFTIRKTIELQSRALIKLSAGNTEECQLDEDFGHNIFEVIIGVVMGVTLTIFFYGIF